MTQAQHTPPAALLEEAIIALFCQIDDAYIALNPRGRRRYASLKRLSDSEVLALALFQQLRGVESERSFLREAARFFSHLFPGVVGLHPSSFHRRVRKLRRFLEPLRRAVVPELVGDPETMIVDSTLLEVLHPRQVPQSAGFDGACWVRWGTFSVYGVKLHMLCATNRVPISYELTAANVAEVRLTKELLEEAQLGEEVARKLLADLAYRGEDRGGTGRVGDRVGNQRGQREASRGETASRDRLFELEASLWSRRDVGDDHHRARDQDRGQDNGLHLRFLHQPAVGSSSRQDQGVVGMNLTTHI
jgi:hypothetical protein